MPTDNDLGISTAWKKFLARFAEIDSLALKDWRDIHFLAYICKRYKTFFKKNFVLSYKGAPSKCTEIFLVKRMMVMLETFNPFVIKEYIDWCFDKKIIPQEMQIRTLAFFGNPQSVIDFNYYRMASSKITRAKELPYSYKEIINALNLSVNTYGDLAFIQMALETDDDSEERLPYRILFDQLQRIGFDPKCLENLS